MAKQDASMEQKFPVIKVKTGDVLGVFDSHDDAALSAESFAHGRDIIVPCKAADLAALDGKALLKAYNQLAGTDVKRFASYGDGIKRLFRFLSPKGTAYTPTYPANYVNDNRGDDDMTTKKKTTAKKTTAKKSTAKKSTAKKTTAKKTTASTAGRSRSYDETTKIKWLVSENPKREGSAAHKRFAKYFKSKTVAEYMENGGTSADLRYEESHGILELAK